LARKPSADDIFAKDRRRRDLQKAKKAARRNREERGPRRKNWLDLDIDEWDDVRGITRDERIMPRDERDRQRAVIEVMVEDDQGDDTPESPIEGAQGRVIEVSTGLCRVEIGGQNVLCYLRGALSADDTGFSNVVAVGDRVIVNRNGGPDGVVERVLPRRTLIARPDPSNTNLRQVLVANVDQLLIVASWRQPHLWPELIDRYLITAARNDVMPLICVNKIDLADDPDELDQAIQPYRALGYYILLTSAARGDGLEMLHDALAGRVTVLAGLSGVGKSSLLTAAQPDFDLRTGRVNEDWGQGRHTTTQAIMLPFGKDSYVIDTPGIREFGLFGLHRAELMTFYPDLAQASGACRFANCTHLHEPDCAVHAGVEAGTINATRYHNYRKIWESLGD
jgi:ribosome biogenesis GTPase